MQQSLFDFPTFTRKTSPPRNIVIEAGAGTGKTTAIVAEVLKLIVERTALKPERIVLMTFTEKAAGEIADRIRIALEELAAACHPERSGGTPVHARSRGSFGVSAPQDDTIGWPLGSPNPLVSFDSSAVPRLEHALENIDALRSQTIHSFCQSLLRSFPIEAGLDPQFKIIEGFERSLLYSQAYDAWIDHETRVAPTEETVAEWELLFAHVGYLFAIRDLVLGLAERRDLFDETEYDFGTLEEVEEPLLDAISAIGRIPDEAGDEHALHVFRYIRESPPPPMGDLDRWIEYLHPIATSIRSANLPRHGVLKEALKVLRAGDKGRSVYDRMTSHRAAMALLSLTRRFVAFLDAEKRKLGVVDFDDLLLRTLAVLDDPSVLSRARAQFDSIFVDEFQDTDRTQARIIDRLARDESGRYVAGRTIVVGDPKQSIYGFRRADPETYYRMTESLVTEGAERRVIADQYRSDPPLVDVINAMFERLFPPAAHDPNVFRPSYHALRAARTTLHRDDLDARIMMLRAEHQDASDRFFAEAEAIAEWILAQRQEDLRRYAILFRRLTKLDDYLDTFDRSGIKYVLPPTRMFLDRRAPVDLLAVLRAIAYPFDRGARISAARTPYFALTDEEIASGVLLSEAKDLSAGTAEDPSSSARLRTTPWSAFQRAIDTFRNRHLTVSQLIDLVVNTCGIEAVYRAAADGTRHLRHLEHLRALAFEYDERTGGSIGQFVDEIARRRSEPEEVEPSLLDESQNAIRIMSVHAAKGLEFDTVILPDLAVQPPSNDTQLFTVEEPKSIVLTGRADSISGNFRFTADGEKLKKLTSRREEAETRRLFYVAVTRAKTDVVFVCNLSEDTKNVGFLKCVHEVLGVDRAGLVAMWNDEGRVLHDTQIGTVAFERIQVRGAEGRKRRRLLDEELETTLATSPIVTSRSAAAPAAALDPKAAVHAAALRNRGAGILLHRVLELWDGTSTVEPLLRAVANETAADPQTIARVRRRLAAIANSDTLKRIARAETIGREVPVRFLEEGALVERRIDRLVREDGHELVIDYKSGAAEETRLERDKAQVARYCRAISEITGRPCTGLLWYIDVESDTAIAVT